MDKILRKQLLAVFLIIALLGMLLVVSPTARNGLKDFDRVTYTWMYGHPPKELTWEERKQYGIYGLLCLTTLAIAAGVHLREQWRLAGRDLLRAFGRNEFRECRASCTVCGWPL